MMFPYSAGSELFTGLSQLETKVVLWLRSTSFSGTLVDIAIKKLF